MKKHYVFGILIGGLLGAVTAWVAMVDALPEGGLVAIAGAFDGVMAGLGIGWLIGINIAEGAVEEVEEDLGHETEPGRLVTAH